MIRRWLRKYLPGSWFQRPTRLDHGRMYMCVMMGLWMTSTSMILVGPVPNSTISNLNTFTQVSMACVLWIGSALCIFGYLSGTRHFRRKTDLRDCYQLAKWSVPAIGVSLGTYVWSIFSSYGNLLLSALGGSIGASILVGSLWNAWDFANEIDRLNGEFGDMVNGV